MLLTLGLSCFVMDWRFVVFVCEMRSEEKRPLKKDIRREYVPVHPTVRWNRHQFSSSTGIIPRARNSPHMVCVAGRTFRLGVWRWYGVCVSAFSWALHRSFSRISRCTAIVRTFSARSWWHCSVQHSFGGWKVHNNEQRQSQSNLARRWIQCEYVLMTFKSIFFLFPTILHEKTKEFWLMTNALCLSDELWRQVHNKKKSFQTNWRTDIEKWQLRFLVTNAKRPLAGAARRD